MDELEKLNAIHNAVSDTQYILDDARPSSGIKKVLCIYAIAPLIINVILYLISTISQSVGLWESENYFRAYRILNIILYIGLFILYYYCIQKVEMTLREKQFLKGFMIVPIFYSFTKLLYPISYYLNFDVLLMLYEIIPLDIIMLIVGLLQIYNYFKKKKYIYLTVITGVYLLVFTLVKIYVYGLLEDTTFNLFIVYFNLILYYINQYNIFFIVILLVAALMMKDEKYEI